MLQQAYCNLGSVFLEFKILSLLYILLIFFLCAFVSQHLETLPVKQFAGRLGGVKTQNETKGDRASAFFKFLHLDRSSRQRQGVQPVFFFASNMSKNKDLTDDALSSLFAQGLQVNDRAHGQRRGSLSLEDYYFKIKRQNRMRRIFIGFEDFLDRKYNFDFTDLTDYSRCWRGDEEYTRPNGWYRIALKVKGKYSDGDARLGTDGWRRHSVHGEWPVSYHGTTFERVEGIIQSHYNAGHGEGHGRGIYSTPDLRLAATENYAKTQESTTTGKRYKVVLQNRINPEKREICSEECWLIPVPRGISHRKKKTIAEASI